MPFEKCRKVFVYLCYLDDSCEDSTHQVICAVIIPDTHFLTVEGYFGYVIEKVVPEELRDEFEFHASPLYHGKPPYDKIDRETAMKMLNACLQAVVEVPIPIVYGAVDLRKLRAGMYATASPIDVAFRLCIPEIERWLRKNKPEQTKDFEHCGIIIADDTKNPHHKTQMQKAFRADRPHYRPSVGDDDAPFYKVIPPLAHIHDDMYFGDSAYSRGIQLADMCCFIVSRHLQGKEDTEFLYKKIEPHIFSAKIEPAT
jgi:hypothetical protein